MNAELLLKHFERISDTPDAVSRLREFILDLAVRGKLVEQDPQAELAAVLLQSIRQEKNALRSQGLKPCPEVPVSDGELPFALPQSWLWVTLSTVLNKLTDGTHHSPINLPEGDFRYITAKNIKAEGVSLEQVTYVSRSVHEEIYARCNPEFGDLLYVKDGATTGIATINNLTEPFSMLSSVALLKPCRYVNRRLLLVFLRSPFFYDQMRELMKGAAITRVTLKRMAPAILPLPPMEEQARIIERVDELMTLCDQLEAAQMERGKRRDRVVASSLKKLSNSAKNEELRCNATYYLNHFPRLASRGEDVKQLRLAILDMAVLGNLSRTENWPLETEPLVRCASLQNGYAFKSEWFATKGVRLLRNINIGHGVVRWGEAACLPTARVQEFERFSLEEGDIVLSLDRPFIATGTKIARIGREDLPCLLLQRVGRFKLDSSKICAEYLFLWLHSSHFASQIDPGRSNGVPHISSRQVESARLFVPSLAEQRRVVTISSQLTTVCEQLVVELGNAEIHNRRLLSAILENVLKSPLLGKVA